MNYDAEIKKHTEQIAELKHQKAMSQLKEKYVIISNLSTTEVDYQLGNHTYHTEYFCYVNTPEVYKDHNQPYSKYQGKSITITNNPECGLTPKDFLFTKEQANRFINNAPQPELLKAGLTPADKFPEYQYFIASANERNVDNVKPNGN